MLLISWFFLFSHKYIKKNKTQIQQSRLLVVESGGNILHIYIDITISLIANFVAQPQGYIIQYYVSDISSSANIVVLLTQHYLIFKLIIFVQCKTMNF